MTFAMRSSITLASGPTAPKFLSSGSSHGWESPRASSTTGGTGHGLANEHNALVPRDWWLEGWEKRAVLDYHAGHPLEGYRRLAFMMLDANVVAVSPSSVYRVLPRCRINQATQQQTLPQGHWSLQARLDVSRHSVWSQPNAVGTLAHTRLRYTPQGVRKIWLADRGGPRRNDSWHEARVVLPETVAVPFRPRLEVAALIEPMHTLIRQEMAERPGVLLAIHDWSTLSFGGHESKKDRVELTHAKDVGYDLATVLMVRGDDGAPIAPALVSLTTAEGVLSTRDDAPVAALCHIDQVREAMRYVDGLSFNTPLVHVIDREADSVNHWRQWSADGHLALVRADDRKVLCDRQETSFIAIADRLHQEDAFKDAGKAQYHGRWARLYVAETKVILHRPGKRNVDASPSEYRIG